MASDMAAAEDGSGGTARGTDGWTGSLEPTFFGDRRRQMAEGTPWDVQQEQGMAEATPRTLQRRQTAETGPSDPLAETEDS